MAIDNTYAQVTPAMADAVRGVIDLAGTPLTRNFLLTALADGMGLPKLIETIDVTATTNIDISLPAANYAHVIEGYCEASVDAANLEGVFTDDDFVSVIGSNYAQSDLRMTLGQTLIGATGGTSQVDMRLATNMGNAAGERCFFRFKVVGHATANPTGIESIGNRINSSGDYNRFYGGASHEGTNLIDGLRIRPSSGTFDVFKAYVHALVDF